MRWQAARTVAWGGSVSTTCPAHGVVRPARTLYCVFCEMLHVS
jgi:hypothetical protein